MPNWWNGFRKWPRPARWTTYVAVGLVLLMVAVTALAVVMVRRPLPQTTGEIEVPGLTGAVEVIRDANGIPQIYADTTGDLMRAQGYVHAQDRFYEMDIRRHVTAGRLSELFGKKTLDTDKAIRTMGWRRVAEQELALIQPDTRAALEAYADGVNAYLDEHSPSEISVEYTLLRASGLDYQPEPWTVVDSLAWLKAMAWDLRGNMDDEIARALLSVTHDQEQIDALYPPYPYRAHQSIVGQGAVVDGVFDQDAEPGKTRNPIRPAYTAGQVGAVKAFDRAVRSVPCDARPERRAGLREEQPHGRRSGQQQLGRRWRSLGHRQAVAGQRPAPGDQHARGLVPGRPALSRGDTRLRARRQRVLVLGGPGCRHRSQRQRRLGIHEPRA